MNNNSNDTKDLSQLFGTDALSSDEQETFFNDVGAVILEGAVLNFLLTLDESEHAEFQSFLATAGEGEKLLETLAAKYPTFVTVLETEIVNFRKEAEVVLGNEQT